MITGIDVAGVQLRGLTWELQASNVIAGMRNPLNITAQVNFVEGAGDVSGENLWRLGLYGSRNAQGSGEKFNYVRQTLNEFESAYPLRGAGDINFRFARAAFDLAAIGCTDYDYMCGEFTKADNPNPDFSFSVYPSGDTKITCKGWPCRAGENYIRFQAPSQKFCLNKMIYVPYIWKHIILTIVYFL